MLASDILSRLKEILEEQAKRFPSSLQSEVEVYFEDGNGEETDRFDAARKTFEAWGELTVSIPDESGTVIGFPVMVAVSKTGEIDDEEVQEVESGIAAEIDECLSKMATFATPEEYLRDKCAEEERKYREELEKFNRSMASMKKTAIIAGAGAIVILLLMMLLKVLFA